MEASCNLPNGIGMVKLMGRSSEFIAAHATLGSGNVDLCLVPEVPIVLDGPAGCLPHLCRRVKEKGYTVVVLVVAEGGGEELLGESTEVDASGNKKLPQMGSTRRRSSTSTSRRRARRRPPSEFFGARANVHCSSSEGNVRLTRRSSSLVSFFPNPNREVVL